MARLYANENFPFQVVSALRDLGHDVLTSLDAGKANQSISDDDVRQANRIHASIQIFEALTGQLIRVNRPQRDKL